MADLESLYIQHFQGVYRFLLSMCRDGALAEELTQETFYRAMKGLKGFRGESSEYSWLCRIAKNAYLNHVRNKAPQPLKDNQEADPGGDALGALLAGEGSAQLHRALHALGEPHREVFTLRVFAQLSHAEIARIFDRSENWSRVTFARAKLRLSEAVQKAESPDDGK